MDRDQVLDWVRRYVEIWRAKDVSAVATLFTADARYFTSPYDPVRAGLPAIEEFWIDNEGTPFTAEARVVAVEGRDAVVRVEVRYGNPVLQEYRDLWVLRFAADGRVEFFEEWAYWPGRPHAAD